MLDALKEHLDQLADPKRAAAHQWFFQTGPGGYGEGDLFIGIRVPELRRAARRFSELPETDLRRLLSSPIHEHRLVALLIMLLQYARGDARQRRRLHRLYLGHTRYINNWDLVDVSAPTLAGQHLENDATPLLRLAKSKLLWERRIAMVATLHHIRRGELDWTFRIAAMLLADPHDLIHKATGWMLREAGKKDPRALRDFLRKHYDDMPRTALRYAIERFAPAERRQWLARPRPRGGNRRPAGILFNPSQAPG